MKKPSEEIIQKFYENRCTEQEYIYCIKYLNSLDEQSLNQFMDSHINKIETENVNKNIDYYPNFNSILNKLNKKNTNDKILKVRKKTFYPIVVSIVSFILISAISLYFLGVFNSSQPIKWNKKVTKLGQKSIITLLDGTRITLNADSKLFYPSKFGKKIREVRLEGEAYFEVTHNSAKPFVVKSGELTTTVLGTKFNIKAYPTEKNIKVALVKGKVRVANKSKSDFKELYLKPQQQVIYNKNNKTEKIVVFNTRKTIGWRNNVLVFENEKLKDVLVLLERTFGIKIEIKKELLGNKRISANFENESFWGIIEVIKYLTNFETKSIMENNELVKIVFTKKQNKSVNY